MAISFSAVEGILEWEFSMLYVKREDSPLESEVFSFEKIPSCTFYILVEYSQTLIDELAITVRKSSDDRVKITRIIISPSKHIISPEPMNWTTDLVFHVSNRYLGSRDITITCEITWYRPSNFYTDTEPFWLNPIMSDFTIMIKGKAVPVHKFILGSQSSVFLEMFESDTRESKENKVTIEDIRLGVMENVLSFLYSGSQKALKHSEMAMEMWIVAEKYNIKKLKDACESRLCRQITQSNVLEIFEHAVRYELRKIRNACVNFIKSNKEEMANEPDFKTFCFENPQLMWDTLI